MNNSSAMINGYRSSSLLVLSVNISMTFVVLGLILHLTTIYVLFRPTMRRRILAPLMLNINIVSIILTACGYSVSMGIDFIGETKNNKTLVFRCRWTAFVAIWGSCAYSSTLCAINVLSEIFMHRCSGGLAQSLSRRCNITILLLLWIYPLFVSALSYFVGDLYRISASELTCDLNWLSEEYLFNTFSSFAIYLLPMLLCLTTQYNILRIWQRSRNTRNIAIRRKLLYRRKINNMVVGLTVYFFASHLPNHVTNVAAMVMRYYPHSTITAFALELLAESNVLCPPLAYLILNSRFRSTVKIMLSGSARRRIQNRDERLKKREIKARNQMRGGRNERRIAPNRVEPLKQPDVANQDPASTISTQSQVRYTGTLTLTSTQAN